MSFIIEKATLLDVPDIANVHVESWKVAYKGIVHQSYLDHGLDKLQRQKRWEKSIGECGDNYQVFVAKSDENIIGFADIGISRDENIKDYAEIYAIYLDPVFYGRGVGRLLFQACKKKAKDMGYKKLFVWVLEGNNRAIDFYVRMGAIAAGKIKDIKIEEKLYRDLCYEWISLHE
jgi:GNAT superfamily N-acetyltransferase